MSKIEEVGNAVVEEIIGLVGRGGWANISPTVRAQTINSLGKAAIGAMLEPSYEMKQSLTENMDHAEAWEAMIKTALGKKPNG